MTNNMRARTQDVVKTNRVWSPVYKTLEMLSVGKCWEKVRSS